jgi:hypothetical protein
MVHLLQEELLFDFHRFSKWFDHLFDGVGEKSHSLKRQCVDPVQNVKVISESQDHRHKTTSTSNLKNHKKSVHHKDKYFKCSDCNCISRSKTYLDTHVNTAHLKKNIA